MKTIAVFNQKGGCGKTTTSVNLAAAIAERQKRVLLIDLDPQAHATIGLGQNPDDLDDSIYDALVRSGVALSEILVRTQTEGLSLAPGSIFLAAADIELSQAADCDLVLDGLLASVQDEFDICVMDCAPSFGLLTINALVASDDVIIPMLAQYYSLEGLRRVLEAVNLVLERPQSHSAKLLNILLTLVDDRTRLSRQIQLQVREIFGPLVFKTVIHNNVRLSEAPSAGQPVLAYAPQSRGAVEYRKLAAEILGGPTSVEVPGQSAPKRRLQKDVFALFDGLGPVDEGYSSQEVTAEMGANPADDTVILPDTEAIVPPFLTDGPPATNQPQPPHE